MKNNSWNLWNTFLENAFNAGQLFRPLADSSASAAADSSPASHITSIQNTRPHICRGLCENLRAGARWRGAWRQRAGRRDGARGGGRGGRPGQPALGSRDLPESGQHQALRDRPEPGPGPAGPRGRPGYGLPSAARSRPSFSEVTSFARAFLRGHVPPSRPDACAPRCARASPPLGLRGPEATRRRPRSASLRPARPASSSPPRPRLAPSLLMPRPAPAGGGKSIRGSRRRPTTRQPRARAVPGRTGSAIREPET